MELRRLRIFKAVVESGSATAAADEVNLTQPAVSRNLKKLEEQIEADLFERVDGALKLTPAGRALLPRANKMLNAAQKAELAVRDAKDQDYYDLRIGMVDSIGTYLFPDVVSPLREALPELEIKLWTARTNELLERLDDGELDAAVIAYSGPPPVDQHVRIGRYDLQYYGLAEEYPELSEIEDVSGLDSYPIVQLKPIDGSPTMVDNDTQTFGLTDSIHTVKGLIMKGFGVGALLHYMLNEEERQKLVRARIPHDPDCAVYVVGSGRITEGDRLWDTFIEVMKEQYPEPA
jgi:DNA-binding transcriptional LysR family regulator